MLSPLSKRFPRELKNNLGRYAGIFVLLSAAVAMLTGILLATGNITRMLDEMRTTYNVEDGRFTLAFKADEETIQAVEALGVHVYENFSYDLSLSVGSAAEAEEEAAAANVAEKGTAAEAEEEAAAAEAAEAAEEGAVEDTAETAEAAGDTSASSTVRIFRNRTSFNKAAYFEGSEPSATNEIALDRAFCDNNNIALGDTVLVDGYAYTVCALVSLSDYTSLFEDNDDFVMNTLSFTVAMVSDEAFEALGALEGNVSYTYSFLLNNRSTELASRISLETDIAQTLTEHNTTLIDLIDASTNQGISYAAEDMAGDETVWYAMLFLVVIVMAFVFSVLSASTIEEESGVIGTLLASGYRRRELLLHYMTLPCVVGVAAALLGNIAGYTVLSEPMRNLYYNVYSLPPYESAFSARVFLLTTVVPVALLLGITFLSLLRALRATPLQFLRH